MTKTRLEAFSDAVLAIVITIMVLEMKIPHEASFHALLQIWPVFLSYAVSFLLLAIYWGNHHHLIHTIREVKTEILWANLHLLFWLSLVPFATGWMSENHFAPVTVSVYAMLNLICALAYFVLLTVIRNCNRNNEAMLEVLRKQSRKGMLSAFLYIIAIPAAFVHILISGMLIMIVGIMWVIPDKNIERSLKNS